MIRSTLSDIDGVIHAVTLPDIPNDYPSGGSVAVTTDCGAGAKSDTLPAHLARKTRHPAFTGRLVTCLACLDHVGRPVSQPVLTVVKAV